MPQNGLKQQRGSARLSKTRTVVFCGLSIALLTVSAWVSVPIWVIPVTLQTFVMVFIVLFLTPRQCMISLVAYLLLGAVGLPVFSSMRGGIGVIMGPTGGFLWGFLLGAIVALFVLWLFRRGGIFTGKNSAETSYKLRAAGLASGESNTAESPYKLRAAGLPSGKRGYVLGLLVALVFLLVMYVCGWAQLVFITGMTPEAAFAAGVAPFVVIDIIKASFAVLVAQSIRIR